MKCYKCIQDVAHMWHDNGKRNEEYVAGCSFCGKHELHLFHDDLDKEPEHQGGG